MRKKVNWWWVVATHERGTVSRREAVALGMVRCIDYSAASNVFRSKRIAEAWLKEVQQKELVPEGIKLRILSNEAWYFARDMYYRGKGVIL